MYWLEVVLSFLVPSSSGLAVLTMPIMAPLADFANVNRDLVAASGAMIGIVRTARPDEEGTRNDSTTSSQYITLINATVDNPLTSPSALCKMVWVIMPLSMMTTIPRAMPIISATPSKSRAPLINLSTAREICWASR